MKKENEVVLRFLAEPADVNFGGKVHGGAVMKWIDQAGYACAVNWCGMYAVTVYVGGIRFINPIQIGNLVEVKARLILTGKTSMHVAVDVYSKKISDPNYVHNTHCIIIFVAMNEAGIPAEVPVWTSKTVEDKQNEAYARKLMDLRKDLEQEMKRFI